MQSSAVCDCTVLCCAAEASGIAERVKQRKRRIERARINRDECHLSFSCYFHVDIDIIFLSQHPHKIAVIFQKKKKNEITFCEYREVELK
jgi:hypothetical protein